MIRHSSCIPNYRNFVDNFLLNFISDILAQSVVFYYLKKVIQELCYASCETLITMFFIIVLSKHSCIFPNIITMGFVWDFSFDIFKVTLRTFVLLDSYHSYTSLIYLKKHLYEMHSAYIHMLKSTTRNSSWLIISAKWNIS